MRSFLGTRFGTIVEITRKYRNPRIKMTKATRIALLALRIYLIFIIGILVYKFFTSI